MWQVWTGLWELMKGRPLELMKGWALNGGTGAAGHLGNLWPLDGGAGGWLLGACRAAGSSSKEERRKGRLEEGMAAGLLW
ncbi:hypothetical protein AAC387_Pa11g0757 [Persea americana]